MLNKKTIAEFGNLKQQIKLEPNGEELKHERVYIDDASVLAFGTKSKEILGILGEPQQDIPTPPLNELDYSKAKTVKVSAEYMKNILKLLTKCPDIT